MSVFTNIQFTNPAEVAVDVRFGNTEPGVLFLSLNQDDGHFCLSGEPEAILSLLNEALGTINDTLAGEELLAASEPEPEPGPFDPPPQPTRCRHCRRRIYLRDSTSEEVDEHPDTPEVGWADNGEDGIPFWCGSRGVRPAYHIPEEDA